MKENSDGSTDDRDSVKSAIDGVLKDAGVDLDQFQSALKPQGGAQGAGGPRQGPPPSDSSTSSTDSTDSASSDFDAALQRAGIDPSQFKSSILATLQSGSTDFSSAFSGASLGSSLDLVA